jgi:hypothetical protein
MKLKQEQEVKPSVKRARQKENKNLTKEQVQESFICS